MLTVRNLSFAYGEIQTLNGVNISIDRGEMVSVIGRNGVGKNHTGSEYFGTGECRIRYRIA